MVLLDGPISEIKSAINSDIKTKCSYLMDHSLFMPDCSANLTIICCCMSVYAGPGWGAADVPGEGKGAAGEASGTGLEEGVGAGCLNAF